MTAIEWTDETWNPVVGCSVVSPGCTNCYAMRLAGGRLRGHPTYEGLTEASKAGPVWNGDLHLVGGALEKPLKWRKPRRIFVNSMGDLFHEDVPDDWIDRVFAVMALCPRHSFQVLTKRPERMREYLANDPRDAINAQADPLMPWDDARNPTWSSQNAWPLPNVWLGTSIEDAPRLARLEALRATPAAVRFISAEPLLGPLEGLDLTGIDWVICGGESGPGARACHPDWIRGIRDQCQRSEPRVPFFFKQWGAWVSVSEVEGDGPHYSFPDGATVRRVGKKAAGRTLDGETWSEFPEVP